MTIRPGPIRPGGPARASLPQVALLAGSVFVVALTAALAAFSIVGSRTYVDRLAEVDADNMAKTLQLNLSEEFGRIDSVLRDLADVAGAAAGADAREAGARLDAGQRLLPELGLLGIVDAQARLVSSRGPVDAAREAQLRPFLLHAARAGASEASIDIETVPSPSHPGHWDLVLARPITPRAGSAGGAAFVTLPLDFLHRFFDPLDVGTQGAITLRDARQQLVMRKAGRAPTGGAAGSSNVSSALQLALRLHPEEGRFRATTAIDGIERLTVYRRIGRYPLVVFVGLGVRETRAGWVTQSAMVAGLAALLLLSILAGGGLLGRAWREARRSAVAFEGQARRNRILLRTASDGLHVLDRGGRLVKFSDSFAVALGRSREELERAHVSQWDAKFDAAAIDDWLTTFKVGERREFETLHRRADGGLIDVEVTSSMVRIDGEDLVYCSARDVTERRKLETRLAESAAQVKSLYDGAPCGYYSLDENGRCVYANDTVLAWLGRKREEVVGKLGPADFLSPEGVEVFRRNFPRLLAGQSVDGLEVDLIGRDGYRRRVSVSASPMLDEQGRFRMTRTVMYDITDLHRTREHLQQVLREQDAMLDNDLIGMVRLRDRRILWTNQAMCRLFGYEQHELVGASTRILYADPERFEEVGREAYAVLAAAGRFHTQRELVRKDGEPLWIEINGVMLSAERGESMWLFADITPSKRAYDEVEFLAFHDPLTGLPNRMLLKDRLQQAMNSALRRGSLVAICYVDLDGFKALNDSLGHAAGDLLLKEVATRLSSCTRAVDTVCRLGGDEFAVVLSELEDISLCHDILGRIEAAMHAAVVLPGFGEAAISASIGVALFPQDGQSPDDLLARADAAMYESKRSPDGKLRLYGAPEAPAVP